MKRKFQVRFLEGCGAEMPSRLLGGYNAVISGWDEGISQLRVGDRVRLTIPASMGYGERGISGVIPGGATLMFDVELVDAR